MNDDRLPVNFDKSGTREAAFDLCEAPAKQVDQIVVGDVAGGDEQQALRGVLKQVTCPEIFGPRRDRRYRRRRTSESELRLLGGKSKV